MEHKALDVFGEILVKHVRDEAIDDWERIFSGKMRDEESQDLFSVINSYEPEKVLFIRNLVSKIVDTTLHHLLWTLEREEIIEVSVRVGDETVPNIKEISDGLAGELYTEDGWIERFSQKK